MSYTTISTPNAPSAIGPYSQAIKTDSLVFLSGCIPLDPVSMKVVEGGVEEQAVRTSNTLQRAEADAWVFRRKHSRTSQQCAYSIFAKYWY